MPQVKRAEYPENNLRYIIWKQIIAIAALLNLEIHRMKTNIVILNKVLDKEIYIKQLESFLIS